MRMILRKKSYARCLSRQFVPHLEAVEDRTLPSTCLVTNLGDTGSGSSLAGDLRYCVNQANARADSGNRIEFEPGLTGTIFLVQGALTITKSVEMEGAWHVGIDRQRKRRERRVLHAGESQTADG